MSGKDPRKKYLSVLGIETAPPPKNTKEKGVRKSIDIPQLTPPDPIPPNSFNSKIGSPNSNRNSVLHLVYNHGILTPPRSSVRSQQNTQPPSQNPTPVGSNSVPTKDDETQEVFTLDL